jgi:hypothetical protein
MNIGMEPLIGIEPMTFPMSIGTLYQLSFLYLKKQKIPVFMTEIFSWSR